MKITIEVFEHDFGVSVSSGSGYSVLWKTHSLEEVIGQVRLSLEGARLKRPLRDQIYQREGHADVEDKLHSDQPAQQVANEVVKGSQYEAMCSAAPTPQVILSNGPTNALDCALTDPMHEWMLTHNPLYRKLVEAVQPLGAGLQPTTALVDDSAATELPVTQAQEMGMYKPEPDVSAITAAMVKRFV